MFVVQGIKPIQDRYFDKNRAIEYFDKRFSQPIWRSVHNRQVTFINTILKNRGKSDILDLACGPARISRDFRLSLINKGVAADSSEAMLTEATKVLDPSWKTIKIDAFNLPFVKNSFDIVTTFRFLRHFDLTDRKKLLAEIHTILNSNGLLIFEALNKNMHRGEFIEKYTGAWDKSIYDETYHFSNLIEEMQTTGFTLHDSISVMNDWPKQLDLQNELESKGVSNDQILEQITDMDQIESKNAFMWVTAWSKI